MTQKDLANRVGVKRQYVGIVERGEVISSVELAIKIARELGVCL